MTTLKRMQDANLKGQRVALRLDLNVPVDGQTVTDFSRIDRAKPTIDALMGAGAFITVMAHFGRPKGVDPKQSLAFLAPVLSQRWGVPVGFNDANTRINLVENLRFNAGEESNDQNFAQSLAANQNIYVNDAFSVSHRAHASVEAITHLLPSYAGLAMQAELDALAIALEKPQKPVAAIVGGAKISTKLDLLGNLVSRVDHLFLGGGMANTFLAALGMPMQKSLVESDMLETARSIMAKAKSVGCTLHLPVDMVVADAFSATANTKAVSVDAIPENYMALDIGPATQAAYGNAIKTCKTALWNGPMGAFEMAPFAQGTVGLAQIIAQSTKSGALTSVAGGGDTLAALALANVTDDFTYVSTAGGAFLEYLEGKTLPGVAALLAA